MSLLLDALQRASKDKEKAASGAAAPAVAPAPAPLPQPPVLATAPAEPSAPPPPQELTLEWDPPVSAPAPVVEPPAAPAPIPALVSTPAPTPAPAPVAPVVTPAPAPAAAQAATPMAPVAPVVPNHERVAQEIRRAYAPQATAARPAVKRRLVVLSAITVALVLGLGSVLGGLWGDPVALLGLGGGSTLAPAVPPPVLVAVAPTPAQTVSEVLPVVPAPVVASAKVPKRIDPEPKNTKDVPSRVAQVPPNKATVPTAVAAPVAPSAAAPAPVSQTGNEVVLRGATSSQSSFVAKNRGPSPLEMGYQALQEGRLDDAARFYGQALRANSEERDALLGLAYIAQQKGLREEAQGYYRRVLRQEPNNAIASAALLALDSESDAGRTSSRARELAARQPDSAATLAMAGNALVRDGQLSDAVQMFARAQALEPANPLHAYNRAVALDRLAQYAAAAVQYEKVLQLSGNPASSGRRAYSVEVVRNRLEQLRQALGNRAELDR